MRRWKWAKKVVRTGEDEVEHVRAALVVEGAGEGRGGGLLPDVGPAAHPGVDRLVVVQHEHVAVVDALARCADLMLECVSCRVVSCYFRCVRCGVYRVCRVWCVVCVAYVGDGDVGLLGALDVEQARIGVLY